MSSAASHPVSRKRTYNVFSLGCEPPSRGAKPLKHRLWSNVPTIQSRHAVLNVCETMLESAVSSGPTLWLVIVDGKGQTLSLAGQLRGSIVPCPRRPRCQYHQHFWKPVKVHLTEHSQPPLKNATSILVGSREIDRISRGHQSPRTMTKLV